MWNRFSQLSLDESSVWIVVHEANVTGSQISFIICLPPLESCTDSVSWQTQPEKFCRKSNCHYQSASWYYKDHFTCYSPHLSTLHTLLRPVERVKQNSVRKNVCACMCVCNLEQWCVCVGWGGSRIKGVFSLQTDVTRTQDYITAIDPSNWNNIHSWTLVIGHLTTSRPPSCFLFFLYFLWFKKKITQMKWHIESAPQFPNHHS